MNVGSLIKGVLQSDHNRRETTYMDVVVRSAIQCMHGLAKVSSPHHLPVKILRNRSTVSSMTGNKYKPDGTYTDASRSHQVELQLYSAYVRAPSVGKAEWH